jgi:hypothetical protein
MLGEEQAHEHNAALAAVHDGYAILYAYGGVLGPARLAGENGVYGPYPAFFSDLAWHKAVLLER